MEYDSKLRRSLYLHQRTLCDGGILMTKKIAVAGKGGVGKTTFTALMIRIDPAAKRNDFSR